MKIKDSDESADSEEVSDQESTKINIAKNGNVEGIGFGNNNQNNKRGDLFQDKESDVNTSIHSNQFNNYSAAIGYLDGANNPAGANNQYLSPGTSQTGFYANQPQQIYGNNYFFYLNFLFTFESI